VDRGTSALRCLAARLTQRLLQLLHRLEPLRRLALGCLQRILQLLHGLAIGGS
jgi:hypothetical protein